LKAAKAKTLKMDGRGSRVLEKIDEVNEEPVDAKNTNQLRSEKYSDNEMSSDEEELERKQKQEDDEKEKEILATKIEFERLSEFFFDLCLSWC